MYLITIDPSNKMDMLAYLNKFKDGTHISHHKFKFYDVEELKISNPAGTKF